MECKACGKWFGTLLKEDLCPTCERAYNRIFHGIPYNRLRELAQADQDGRLVVLPCKVGDTVYVINGLWVSQYIVSRFWYDGLFFHFKAVNEEYAEECCEFYFFDERIGKTVFLTREEAEAALKAQKEAQNKTEGCPRYRVNDGIHGINSFEVHEEKAYAVHGCYSKEQAIEAWNRRAEK